MQNKRTLSGMIFIMNYAKYCLRNKHMNAALRIWSEKDQLLADDDLFTKMWEHFQQHGLSAKGGLLTGGSYTGNRSNNSNILQ